MQGFWHYFFSTLDPMSNLGFSTGWTQMESIAPNYMMVSWCAIVGLTLIIWFVYQARPALVRPQPRLRSNQAQPMVSVVIAGRNESATIGDCIQAALRCGYSNLEVIFVDDNSSDDSVAIARRAALAVTGSRYDTDRLRIFPSPRRNGKASSLNVGIRMARGEFIVIHDADSKIQYGIMPHWLLPFEDPQVGGVVAAIRVDNSTTNLLTRLQELEYALKFDFGRFLQAKLGIMSIITGMGGIFRGEVLRRLGGFDSGLGDDTDLSTMLLKQRFKLTFSLDAVVWTTVPDTRAHLWSQRMRWRRNCIKIRVSKHRDMFFLGRYGFPRAIITIGLIMKLLPPVALIIGIVWATFESGILSFPELITSLYWIVILLVIFRLLMVREILGAPKWINFPLVFLFPFYNLWLFLPTIYAEWAELLRIGSKHPYVPDHVWEEIPWW